MVSLKIGTLNVKGIHSPAERKKTRMYLTKTKIDVAYLQEEMHLLPPEVEKLGMMGWKVLAYATFTSKARGVVIISIDYILASVSLFPRILEAHKKPICLTDHALCWIRVAQQVDRGPYRQWRFLSYLTQ